MKINGDVIDSSLEKVLSCTRNAHLSILYQSGCTQSLLNATSHNHTSFSKFSAKSKPAYIRYTFGLGGSIRKEVCCSDGKPRGKKNNLIAQGALDLVLMWHRTRGSCMRSLPISFGQTCTTLHRWLKYSHTVLLHILSRDKIYVCAYLQMNRYTFIRTQIPINIHTCLICVPL